MFRRRREIGTPAPKPLPQGFRPSHNEVSVAQTEGALWDGACSCGFRSVRHPSESDALGRMRLHTVEHRTGTVMPALR